MSLANQACKAILVTTTALACASALVMIGCVYEGDGLGAWVWAALFFGSSAVAAWCFGGWCEAPFLPSSSNSCLVRQRKESDVDVEQASASIDALISKRAAERGAANLEEMAWKASVRKQAPREATPAA